MVTAPANVNHFNCWRSTPREGRNRINSATTEASPHPSHERPTGLDQHMDQARGMLKPLHLGLELH
jgi:hypothetical protein